MKFLKRFGLHHGLALVIISWLGFLLHPLMGIYLSIFMAGWYFGREEKEAENRGFRPLTKLTWQLDKFELPDFLMPLALSIINILVMIRIIQV